MSRPDSHAETEVVMKAAGFAQAAHEAVGQRRKYTDAPYFSHAEAVAAIVAQVPHTAVMLAAAYLHDTIEDTRVTANDIELEFGAEVCALVLALTDASNPSDGSRAQRKAWYRDQLAKASPEAMTIKLADIIDNTSTIVELDPGFAAVYLLEKQQLLEVLQGGDARLRAEASRIVAEGLARLYLTTV